MTPARVYPVHVPGLTASGGYRQGIAETEYRERALEGRWYNDLRDEIERQFGQARAEITGIPDISRNALLRMTSRLGAYTPAPMCTGIDDDYARVLGDSSGPVARAQYSSLARALRERDPDMADAMGLDPSSTRPMPSALVRVMSTVQRYWLACNEAGVYASWAGDRLHHQLVRSSQMRGQGYAHDPGLPALLGWQRWRMVGGRAVAAWDVWDIRDEDRPTYRIVSGASWTDGGDMSGGEDITGLVLPGATGDYWWRYADGRPYIPVEVYHRGLPSSLFDRATGAEVAQGALTVAVLYTFWLHICRDASWPQRVIEGLILGGAASDTEEGPSSIPTDPATLLSFSRIAPDKPGTFHQFDPGADPEVYLRAIRAYEQTLTEQMVPVDFSSTGGDPLEREAEAIRRQAETLYPVCRQHDASYLGKCAAIANRATSATDYEGERLSLPESGYGIIYQSEIEALRRHIDSTPARVSLPPGLSDTVAGLVDAMEQVPEEMRADLFGYLEQLDEMMGG